MKAVTTRNNFEAKCQQCGSDVFLLIDTKAAIQKGEGKMQCLACGTEVIVPLRFNGRYGNESAPTR